MGDNDPILKQALSEMLDVHGCHTVILYGSRARGDFTAASDYDLIGFRRSGPQIRDARLINGKFLDAFIYPDSEAEKGENKFLHLRNGKILKEENGFGSSLLKQAKENFIKGPEPLPADEIAASKAWIDKMLKRAALEDLEGNFRRSWLLFELLQLYFQFRNYWYLGPKESFQWLKENDPSTSGLFKQALDPGADLAKIEALARVVIGK